MENIGKMARKAQNSGVRFRPHFKTHQSAEVGEWFREFGVVSITVSSVDMATYSSKNGWKDITIAFPVNICEIERINELASKISLNLLVDSHETTLFVIDNLKYKSRAWIDIDVGYKRTGVSWEEPDKVARLAAEIEGSKNLSFAGVLTHAGHSYSAKSTKEVGQVYFDTLNRMKFVQNRLEAKGFSNVETSVGDTPTCSITENFDGLDEIRPGNFVFYDVMQLKLGSCSEEDIAVSLACPVVAKCKERNEIVIHGGAVHLSKEFILDEKGRENFGYVSVPQENGWGPILQNAYVSSLSQEHGIVKAVNDLFDKIQIGDMLMIIPVHSCLTADLMREYVTTEGKLLQMMPKFL